MNLKRWMMLVITALALAACGSPAVGTPVARVDNLILSRLELDQRIARSQEALNALAAKRGGNQSLPSNQEVEQRLVEQFIQENLTLNIARQRGIAIGDGEVDTLIDQIGADIQRRQSDLTIEDVVHIQLGLVGVDAPEFRKFISSLVAQRKLAETLVTTDTVRLDLTNQMSAQASQKVDQVHAADILVETEEEAKKVLDRLAKGEAFEALAKELSKDTSSAPSGGDLGWLRREQLQQVPELSKTLFDDLKPGEITKTPVKTDFGYYVIKVLEHEQRATMTEEQARQAVEQNISGELQNRRGQAFQQLLAAEREKAKTENRLVEPTFPTPVPQQPVQEQPLPTPQP